MYALQTQQVCLEPRDDGRYQVIVISRDSFPKLFTDGVPGSSAPLMNPGRIARYCLGGDSEIGAQPVWVPEGSRIAVFRPRGEVSDCVVLWWIHQDYSRDLEPAEEQRLIDSLIAVLDLL